MNFAASLTQWRACYDKNTSPRLDRECDTKPYGKANDDDLYNEPHAGWGQLYRELTLYTETQDSAVKATDISWSQAAVPSM